MSKNILITGGSGLIGRRMTEMMLERGYRVEHLSRTPSGKPVKTYRWDVMKQSMDQNALKECEAIIHLAGAGIAEKRWTGKRKKELAQSRTHSTRLLFDNLRSRSHRVRTFISASAIGYYGFGDDNKVFVEPANPADDFLADLTKEWEAEADRIASLGIRVVKIRIGIVLSGDGGALKEIARPVKWGVGAPLATGNQWVSWIHIDDVCGMFMHALENPGLQGAYNATGPSPVTNSELTRKIADVLGRSLWLPHVPGFLLKIMFGEIAEMVINGSKVSAGKIITSGYSYRFSDLKEALKDLLTEKAGRHKTFVLCI